MSIGFIVSSFLAGVITFLAPCTLPLVPAYLGFISGTAENDDKEALKKRVWRNGLGFVLGFSLVFVLFGVLAGLLGQALIDYKFWLTKIGGVMVIVFGLFMLGIFKSNLLKTEKRLKLPSWLTPGKPTSSFIVGGAFAIGWTPCVGPVLGSILLLASASSTALQGGVMLAVFSLGLAIPFLVVAWTFSRATAYIAKITRYLKWVSRIGGVFLVALGLLLVTDNFSLTLQYGYELFDFVNYEGLTNFL